MLNHSKIMTSTLTKVRIDKWLWAARFFKTRSLAKQAIEGGKVRVNGDRAKASKEIGVGAALTIRQGWDDKVVDVIALSEHRKGATEAQLLYSETAESTEKREMRAEERRVGGANAKSATKPNTKERRLLQRVKRDILGESDS